MRALLLALAACSALDAADGHIDSADHCCASLDIEACLARFVEPNHCKEADCLVRHALVCRALDGGLIE